MTDRCIRAAIAWSGMVLIVAFWIGAAAWLATIVTPAARAVIEAATTRPAACQGLSASDCVALAQDGGW